MLEELMMQILFLICFLMVTVTFCVFPYISRKNVSFGISIPSGEWGATELRAMRKSYTRWCLAGSAIFGIPAFYLLLSSPLNTALPAIAITAALSLQTIFFGILYLSFYRKMKTLKSQKGWDVAAHQIVTATLAQDVGKSVVSARWLLLMPLIIVATLYVTYILYPQAPDIVPTHWNGQGVADAFSQKAPSIFMMLPGMQFLIFVVFAFSYISIRQAKRQIDPDNPETSLAQNNKFRHAWSIFIVANGAIMCLMFVPIQLAMLGIISSVWFIVSLVVSIAIILGWTIYLTIRYGQSGNRVNLAKSTDGSVINRNDDRYWKLGAFYVNKDDPALFLEKRFSVGWTMNYGRPATYIIIFALFAFIGVTIWLSFQATEDKKAPVPETTQAIVETTNARQTTALQSDAFDVPVNVGTSTFAVTGILRIPAGNGPFPCVILVAGSGPNDMDTTIGPNKPFKDIAEGLSEKGIAVLRYNKITKENPSALAPYQNTLTLNEEYLPNAHDAIALAASDARIDSSRIFVAGHSLGGTALPRIAKVETVPAGYIFVAGSSENLLDAFVRQYTYLFGFNGEITDQEQEQLDAIQAEIDIIRAAIKEGKSDEPAHLGAPYSYWADLENNNPLDLAADVKKPVLILQGGRDYQVLPEQADAWEKALVASPSVTKKVYPALNHILIAGEGPSSGDEYSIAGKVSDELILDMADWVLAQ